MRRWAIVLVILLALLIGADRIGSYITSQVVADRIESTQGLSSKPGVTIHGFPFLTQLIGMDFTHVTVDAHDVTRNGVHVSRLEADLHTVKPQNGFNAVHVNNLRGSAMITYADLTNAIGQSGVSLAYAGDGQVKVTGSITILGQQMQGSVLSSITVSGDNVVLHAQRLESGFPGLGSVVPRGLDYTIRIGTLPMHLVLQSVTAGQDGVSVAATASDVLLNGSSGSTTG